MDERTQTSNDKHIYVYINKQIRTNNSNDLPLLWQSDAKIATYRLQNQPKNPEPRETISYELKSKSKELNLSTGHFSPSLYRNIENIRAPAYLYTYMHLCIFYR